MPFRPALVPTATPAPPAIPALLVSLALVTALSGCDYLPFGYTPVGDITRDPQAYQGQKVKVKGQVTGLTKIPFVDVQGYLLGDGGGEIFVSTADVLPARGERLAVVGTVESTALIGNEAVGLQLRETERLPSWLARLAEFAD